MELLVAPDPGSGGAVRCLWNAFFVSGATATPLPIALTLVPATYLCAILLARV
jgi:hypothetical protein